ncbi:hypothetical protein KPL74_07980 [Bacillus sp. NP157]|nr:hypothetical protein KPL74_07980 [Bacillus sp. NP157]
MPNQPAPEKIRSNALLLFLFAAPSIAARVYSFFGDPLGLIDIFGSCFSVRIRSDLTRASLRPSASLAFYTLAIPIYIRYAIGLRKLKDKEDPPFSWLIVAGTTPLLVLALYIRTGASDDPGQTQLRFRGLMELAEQYQAAHDAFVFSLVLSLSLCITLVVSKPVEILKERRRKTAK